MGSKSNCHENMLRFGGFIPSYFNLHNDSTRKTWFDQRMTVLEKNYLPMVVFFLPWEGRSLGRFLNSNNYWPQIKIILSNKLIHLLLVGSVLGDTPAQHRVSTPSRSAASLNRNYFLCGVFTTQIRHLRHSSSDRYLPFHFYLTYSYETPLKN